MTSFDLIDRNIEELKEIVTEIRKVSYETNVISLEQNIEQNKMLLMFMNYSNKIELNLFLLLNVYKR